MKTDFTKINFDPDPENHSYTYQGIPLTSVTALCKMLEPPFDRDGISQRVAAKQGRPVADILAEWDAKGTASRELGNRVHEYIRFVLTGQAPAQDPITALSDMPPEIQAFDNYWRKAQTTMNVKEVEWVIGDAAWGIAGTVDALAYHYGTSKFHLFDWKTGKLNHTNDFSNLRPPFDDLDAAQFQKYSLQLGLYRLILERNAGLPTPLGDSYLVHLTPHGSYQIHQALDLGDRLTNWLDTLVNDKEAKTAGL